jgi:LysM repeat protein
MSAVEGLPAPVPSARPPDRPRSTGALPVLCPYLATPDGSWRSATAVREHRCTAVTPPTQLALEKQRRLCLVAAHTGCATYGAAEATRVPARRIAARSRPIARMTPVILDHGRFVLHFPTLRGDRALGQAILVGVLGIALMAILFARPSGDAGAAGGLGSASPAVSEAAPTEVAAATPAATTTEPTEAAATDEPVSTPAPSTGPSPAASSAESAEPSTSGATYKVKSGDTLSAIALRFGTTVRALVQLNGITDPSRLKIGQVIKLP